MSATGDICPGSGQEPLIEGLEDGRCVCGFCQREVRQRQDGTAAKHGAGAQR